MCLLPFLANLNIDCRKAAAPNNGAAAFFFSTNFSVLRHIVPLFEEKPLAGNASKKAEPLKGSSAAAMAKNVADGGKTANFAETRKKLVFGENFFSKNALFACVQTG